MSLANLLSAEQIIPEMKATERWTAIVELIEPPSMLPLASVSTSAWSWVTDREEWTTPVAELMDRK